MLPTLPIKPQMSYQPSFRVATIPALLHPGNNSLIFPNSPIFHLYNPAKKRSNRIPNQVIEKGLLNLSKLTVFSLFPLFFFPFPQIYPPAQHFFFCLWQKVLLIFQHDLPIISTIKKRKIGSANFLT